MFLNLVSLFIILGIYNLNFSSILHLNCYLFAFFKKNIL